MEREIRLFNYKDIRVIYIPDTKNIWLEAPDSISRRSLCDSELREAPQEAWFTTDSIKVPNLWHEFYRNKLHSKFGSLWDDIVIFAMEYDDRKMMDNEGFINLDETFKIKFVDGGGDIFAVNKLIIYKGQSVVAEWTTDCFWIKKLIPIIKKSKLYKELCKKYV